MLGPSTPKQRKDRAAPVPRQLGHALRPHTRQLGEGPAHRAAVGDLTVLNRLDPPKTMGKNEKKSKENWEKVTLMKISK